MTNGKRCASNCSGRYLGDLNTKRFHEPTHAATHVHGKAVHEVDNPQLNQGADPTSVEGPFDDHGMEKGTQSTPQGVQPALDN